MKAVKYTLMSLGGLLALLLIFSPKLRSEAPVVWATVSGSLLDNLKARLDQGTLALARFDEEYTKAEQKLVTLRHLKLDAQHSAQHAREVAAQYSNQGKVELAQRNEKQAVFFEKQEAAYAISIENRSKKLVELRQIRELAREDVRLARERIAMLQATRDALDNAGQEEALQEAQENINSLQSHCNRLHAEIEVMQLTD